MSTMSLPFKDGRRLAVRGGGRTKTPVKVSVRFPVLPQAVEEEPETVVVEEEPETVVVEEEPETVVEPEPAPGAPKGNASRAAWRDYADTLGIKTGGMTRAEIRDAVKEANQ